MRRNKLVLTVVVLVTLACICNNPPTPTPSPPRESGPASIPVVDNLNEASIDGNIGTPADGIPVNCSYGKENGSVFIPAGSFPGTEKISIECADPESEEIQHIKEIIDERGSQSTTTGSTEATGEILGALILSPSPFSFDRDVTVDVPLLRRTLERFVGVYLYHPENPNENEQLQRVDNAEVINNGWTARAKVNSFTTIVVAELLFVEQPGEPAPTEPEPVLLAIGSDEHPIKLLLYHPFPSVEETYSRGEVIANGLQEITGLYFEIIAPTSYAAAIEELCASPTDTVAFFSSQAYVLVNDLCGANVSFTAVRFGSPVFFSEFLVSRYSYIYTLNDLNGATWAYPDSSSITGYMAPATMLELAGIKPGDRYETGGHTSAVEAVYSGDIDFATTFYLVPQTPQGVPYWDYEDYLNGNVTSDMYDIPSNIVDTCGLDLGGSLLCSGWRPLDARINIRQQVPEVIQELAILTISEPMPNDTVTFGPDFPAVLRGQVEDALLVFSKTEGWNESLGSDQFYDWDSIVRSSDFEFDFLRRIVEVFGITIDDLN